MTDDNCSACLPSSGGPLAKSGRKDPSLRWKTTWPGWMRAPPTLHGVMGTGSTAPLPAESWKALMILKHLGSLRNSSEGQLTSGKSVQTHLGSPVACKVLTPDTTCRCPSLSRRAWRVRFCCRLLDPARYNQRLLKARWELRHQVLPSHFIYHFKQSALLKIIVI